MVGGQTRILVSGFILTLSLVCVSIVGKVSNAQQCVINNLEVPWIRVTYFRHGGYSREMVKKTVRAYKVN